MVTQALLPALTQSSGAPRIINVVSIGAFAAVPILPAYSASKAAAFSVTQFRRARSWPNRAWRFTPSCPARSTQT